jgi:hypothetical protein
MLGLEGCTALQELYLSHNGIRRLEGLDVLTQLRVLDVSSNLITRVRRQGRSTPGVWGGGRGGAEFGRALASAPQPLRFRRRRATPTAAAAAATALPSPKSTPNPHRRRH